MVLNENRGARKSDRGSALLLAMSLFFILAILSMSFFKTTQELRKDTATTFLRLHAQSALENSLIEALSRFKIRVNQAKIRYKARPRKHSSSAKRRYEVTGGNNAALKRFLAKHEGKRQMKIARVSPRRGIAQSGRRITEEVVIPADPWYTAFRDNLSDFSVKAKAPHAKSLMGKICPSISFAELRIKVVDLEDPSAKERARGVRAKGLLAISAELNVERKDVNFDRSLEYRHQFTLADAKAPSCVQDGDYSRVYLKSPPVASFLNRQLIVRGEDEEN